MMSERASTGTALAAAESDFVFSAKKPTVSQNTYIIRPNFSQKPFYHYNNVETQKWDDKYVEAVLFLSARFRPAAVKEVIHLVLAEKLHGKSYNSEDTTTWTKDIADTVKARLKEMGYDRYKFVVQAVIGEQKGEGVKMACRCFWDSDTDNYAQDIFINDSLFCVTAAFGVFKY